ncbi:LPXTG cell wall anchor domain-containing protein [Dactylosporangium sp. NPDC005555]|uniref:LPXTG cell wall anchor domain-containing protein n=1 Tax=Dactylosporangium sp. NPDC005555 TaxID=3154889 RepID=UPI0033B2CA58
MTFKRTRALGLTVLSLAVGGPVLIAAPAYAATTLTGAGTAWLTPAMTADSPGRIGRTTVAAGSAADLAGLTAEFDTTGLGTAVVATPPADCTTAGKKITCPLHDQPSTSWIEATVDLVYRAGPGAAAAAGTKLSVPVRVTGPNAGPLTGTATVLVIHGADPVPTRAQVQLQGRSRSPVPLPVSFTNWGDRPLDGFWVRVNGHNAWTSGTTPSAGCELISTGEPPSVRCRVDTRVEAGGKYDGPPISIPMMAVSGTQNFTLWAEPFTKPEPANSYDYSASTIDVHLTSSIPTDLAVEGATVSGETGQTVSFTVTVRNLGPADLPTGSRDGDPLWLVVEVPAGTTPTVFPPGCGGEEQPKVTYRCWIAPLANGRSATYTFGVTINTKIADATGKITYEPYELGDFADPNPANNAATVVVNPTPHLPATGDRIAWTAAGGVATVVAGAVLLLWARRRRTVVLVAGEDEIA